MVYYDAYLLPDESDSGLPLFQRKMADPVIIENIKAKYGLDRLPSEQYVKYMSDYTHGDFGISFMKKGLTANGIISSGFPQVRRHISIQDMEFRI